MVRADYFDNPDHLPDYYDTMYLDGFEPWQILEAAHRTLYKRYQAQKEQQSEDYNIKLNSEIKVKK